MPAGNVTFAFDWIGWWVPSRGAGSWFLGRGQMSVEALGSSRMAGPKSDVRSSGPTIAGRRTLGTCAAKHKSQYSYRSYCSYCVLYLVHGITTDQELDRN